MEKSVNGKLLLDLLDPPQKTRVQVTLVLKYYCIELVTWLCYRVQHRNSPSGTSALGWGAGDGWAVIQPATETEAGEKNSEPVQENLSTRGRWDFRESTETMAHVKALGSRSEVI